MPHFEIRRSGLTSEVFDGELLIVDYDSGVYYSVSSFGALVWKAIAAGHASDAIAERAAAGSAETGALVTAFIEALGSQQLIVERPAPSQYGDWPDFADAGFAPPVIERFDDLNALLLLDPVHDVDQMGWPHRA